MSTPFDQTELRELLDALVEESITAEQMRRVEALVLGHPEAEVFYVQYLSMVADLGRRFAAPAGEESLRRRLGTQPPRLLRLRRRIIVVAAVACAAALL